MKKPLSLLLILILLGASFYMGQQSVVTLSQSPLNLGMANAVWDVISQSYLHADEVDPDSLKYGLAKGLVNSLGDQHSAFMTPEEAEAFLISLNGDLQGIGAELKLQDGLVMVVNPLPDSPAERAGIMPGDIILKVDDERLGNVENLLEIVMKIRGEKGTPVTLQVIHEDNSAPIDITIVRDEIHMKAVSWKEEEYLGKSYAHLTLSSFTETVGAEFGGVLADIMDAGHTQLVLDMRFNGGGYLEGAINVLSYFTEPNMPVVLIRDQKATLSRTTHVVEKYFAGDIVVLVNDSSASASEIVAGALQDYELGHVLGVTTFGKGTVQEVHPFGDQSMMRITVAEWLTPLERSIEGAGIEPDEVVDLDYDAFKNGEDNQLHSAFEYLSKL